MKLKKILRQFYGNRIIILFLLVLWGYVISGYGAEIKKQFTGNGDAISVASNRMVLRERENLVIFEGNVVVKGKSMVLEADKVEINFKRDEGYKRRRISTIIASGNVKLSQENRMVQSDKLTYYRDAGKMVFTGSPHILEGTDEIYGKKIIVYINSDKVVIEGGEAVIHPK